MAKRTNTFPTITTLQDADTVTGIQGGALDVNITIATLKSRMTAIQDAGNYFSTDTVDAAFQQLGAFMAAAPNAYQPKDSDLTAIAALTTTPFGRALLTMLDGPATLAAIGAQPLDADLTAIATLTTTAYGRTLLTLLNQAAFRAENMDIVGTGSPEGVITATVGNRYRDTAATNGAIEWIKATGSGNTGWRVTFGDTGQRNILTNIGGGFTATSFSMRRLGDMVHIIWSNLKSVDGNPDGENIYTPPAGFSVHGSDPASGSLGNIFAATNVVGNHWAFQLAPQLRATKVLGGDSTAATYVGGISYLASQTLTPWPIGPLPGT